MEKLTRETCPHPEEFRFVDELDGIERCGYLIGQWPYVAHPVPLNRGDGSWIEQTEVLPEHFSGS